MSKWKFPFQIPFLKRKVEPISEEGMNNLMRRMQLNENAFYNRKIPKEEVKEKSWPEKKVKPSKMLSKKNSKSQKQRKSS